MIREQELGSEWTHDAAAFAAIYREHAPRIRAFLSHMVGSRQAAEDVTQEIFVQLWQRPSNFDPSLGSFRAYLFGVAKRRALGWWRQTRPESAPVEDVRCIDSLERSSIIADALGRLTEEQRMLLWLREVEGQSYAELATILNIPLGTVRSRLFAARQALRAIWQDTKSEGGPHEVR